MRRLRSGAPGWAGKGVAELATMLSYQKAWSAATQALAHSQSREVLIAGSTRESPVLSKYMMRASAVRPTMKGWM